MRAGTGVVMWTTLMLTLASAGARAQPREKAVKDLSLEELLNVEVTSVARKAQRLSDSAAAVYVLTRADIRRSGATTVPGVLRLVPGVQVARIDSNKWAVSVRGFNSRFANKLLVLVDGRTAYSPLYSGVFWETLDIPLEDIERVEVIRGPGGTMWGANAVNGVINIITTHARDSRGSLVSVAAETNGPGGIGVLRHGWRLGETGGVRVFGKGFDRAMTSGPSPHDQWALARTGFRADGGTPDRNVSLQGSVYRGTLGQTYGLAPSLLQGGTQLASDVDVRGGHLAGAWTRGRNDRSVVTVRSFVDYAFRSEFLVRDARWTADVEAQHRVPLGRRHDAMWGGGYRHTGDDVVGTAFASFDPRHRGAHLYSGFVQDEFTLSPSVRVTAGTKYEHSTVARGGWQPSARMLWSVRPDHAVWAAASRALRTPSRAELDVHIVTQMPPAAPGLLPTTMVLQGDRNLRPEVLVAVEGGYRGRLGEQVSVDVTGFVNRYRRLLSTQPGTPEVVQGAAGPYVLQPVRNVNGGTRRHRGAEVALEWHPSPRVRLASAYSFLDPERVSDPFSDLLNGADPRHQLTARLQVDTAWAVEVDPTVRYVSSLQNGSAPAYTALDLHLSRRVSRALEVALVASNLLGANQIQFTPGIENTIPSRSQRSALLSATWRF